MNATNTVNFNENYPSFYNSNMGPYTILVVIFATVVTSLSGEKNVLKRRLRPSCLRFGLPVLSSEI